MNPATHLPCRHENGTPHRRKGTALAARSQGFGRGGADATGGRAGGGDKRGGRRKGRGADAGENRARPRPRPGKPTAAPRPRRPARRRRQPGRPARLPGCERAARRKRNPPLKNGNSPAAWQVGGRVHFFPYKTTTARAGCAGLQGGGGASPRLAAQKAAQRGDTPTADQPDAPGANPNGRDKNTCYYLGVLFIADNIMIFISLIFAGGYLYLSRK